MEESHTRINAQGILSYTYQGETRAICDDSFSDDSARVACKELYGEHATLSHWTNGNVCSE